MYHQLLNVTKNSFQFFDKLEFNDWNLLNPISFASGFSDLAPNIESDTVSGQRLNQFGSVSNQ